MRIIAMAPNSAICQKQGDRPIDMDVLSNQSNNSNFKSEARLKSVLWSCKQLDPIKPTTNTQMSSLFSTGMGTSAPKTMRTSLSQPKLNLNGFQNKFNRDRDDTYRNGKSMKAVLDYEQGAVDAASDGGQMVTERRGLKMVNKDMMPNFRLNSM